VTYFVKSTSSARSAAIMSDDDDFMQDSDQEGYNELPSFAVYV
jgi:hypothetical protein